MANSKHLAILKQGVEVWNKWKKENPKITIDLSNTKLNSLDLSEINLSYGNLSNTDCSNTKFRNSELWSVNFSHANLKNTDFSDATILGCDFRQSNLTNSHLFHANAFESDFSDANLDFANFSYGELSRAKFIKTHSQKADFSYTFLRDASFDQSNLENANFTQAHVLGTNFNQTILTGICIDNWNISKSTNFNDVICDYVYLEKGIAGQHQRRFPNDINRIFSPKEFRKLFEKIAETVDLVFLDGINWQAFLHSFQKLQIECNSKELAIQAIERKSDDAFIIRVQVPPDANKAEIEKYIHKQYQIKIKSLEENYKLKLNAKDEQIDIYRQHNTDLLEIIKLKANQPVNLNNSMSNINQYHSGNGDNVGRDKNINNIHESLELTQTIEDIQAVLKKLEQTYNPNTTTGKMTIATKAIEQIEQDSNLATRVITALEKGGMAWLQAKLINPSASFLIAALEDWQKNKQ